MNTVNMPQLSSPRRLAFRGHVEAFAWGFPRSLVAPDELPGRVLALWQSGARLEEFEWGHVLFLPSPQKVRAEMAPALVLTRHSGGLVSAPPPRGDEPGVGTWVIEDGDWHALQNGRLVDVSQWLDVGSWRVPATKPLGEVPEVPTLLAPINFDLRAQSGIQGPDAQWQAIWERGGGTPSSFPLPAMSSSLFIGFLSNLFTPQRDAGNAPFASDTSIALSGLATLITSLIFMVQAWLSPPNARGLPIALLLAVVAAGTIRFLMGRLPQFSQPKPSTSPIAPPIVVSPGVQNVAGVFVAIGLLGVAFSDVGKALAMLIILAVAMFLGRKLGITGTLIGQGAVGVSASSASGTGVGVRRGGESWFARWLRKRGRGSGGGTPAPKTRDDTSDMWRRLMAQAAFKSGLFKTLGRAQARYLLRSMEMFERGDLDAALRHAIPLGGKSDGSWSPPPALGLPGARPDLNLSFSNAPARGTMNFGPEIEERLTALYRRAFEKLRDAGDIHKAAFVLADLLQNAEEAVEFLEKHREFEMAARLAEGRQLAPGLVVRAWWLAGNRSRAVQIAQLRDAFGDAIVRLEKSPEHNNDAATLRLLWGHHLASQGRYDAAVEAVWPVPQGHPFASKWMRLGLEEGVSPRLLARALALEPDSWNEWLPLLETLLSEERNANGARHRARFARELDAQKNGANAAAAVAARWTARALLRDGANHWGYVEQSVWTNLLLLSGDGLLRADSRWAAPLHKPSELSKRSEPLEIAISSEGGTLNARDAVLLESGELLVAFGELGARLLSWDGRTKAQFDVPAHNIVCAFDAPRALLLAPRDNIWRVTKLDISRRKASFWGDVRANCFARNYDGATWFVGSDGRVRAFDVAAPTPSALWDSGDMNGNPVELAISRNSLAALVEKPTPANSPSPSTGDALNRRFESWQFELPALILRSRMKPRDTPFTALSTQYRIRDNGQQLATGLQDVQSPLILMSWPGGEERSRVPFQQVSDFITAAENMVILGHDGQRARATLLSYKYNQVLANIRFEGANHIGAHECGGTWVLWDDRGRVIALNSTNGAIEREWILN
ncbi:hypothetical protein EON83_26155 [bacterium]|nr:MAG: hypothetical protein EON83_26155 [bacterium]